MKIIIHFIFSLEIPKTMSRESSMVMATEQNIDVSNIHEIIYLFLFKN